MQAARKEGKATPLDLRPDMNAWQAALFRSWRDLRSIRPGMGGDFLAWCEVHGVEGDDRIDFWELLVSLEGEAAKIARESSNRPPKHGELPQMPDRTGSPRRDAGG